MYGIKNIGPSKRDELVGLLSKKQPFVLMEFLYAHREQATVAIQNF